MEFTAFKKEIHAKVDKSYIDLNAKFEFVTSHFKALDNKMAQITSTSKRPMVQLPCKIEVNPKEYVNSIQLRSGRKSRSGDQIEENVNLGEEVDNPVEEEDVVVEDVDEKEEVHQEVVANKEKGKS
ncbi:unnamed protein product [Cochlearia groenlandica]